MSESSVDVVVVGAGPYGLSIAAHLNALCVPLRIFGTPMHTWREMMPKGMALKSEGFASFLSDPDEAFTLRDFCRESGQPYADVGMPVPLNTFANYGLEFQKRFVPGVETSNIASIKNAPSGFELLTETGETIHARRVVVAAGITHFGYLPPVFDGLPEALVSHSSRHAVLDGFRGRKIVIVGAGSSAVDLAALLNEAGAHVELVGRRKEIIFFSPPSGPKPILERIKNPRSTLGEGWRGWLCAEAPLIFHRMPEEFRLRVVRGYFGPSVGWSVREKVIDRFPLHLGVSVQRVEVQGSQVAVRIQDNGAVREIVADHVIAGTGYQMGLGRLKFLDVDLVRRIHVVADTPILGRSFESSVPGLFFVGAISSNSFGPLTRFVCGAKFTARHLSRHLARTRV